MPIPPLGAITRKDSINDYNTIGTAFGYAWFGNDYATAHAPQRGNQYFISIESLDNKGDRHGFQLSSNRYSEDTLFYRSIDNNVWSDWRIIQLNAIQ